jgi:hypothetical protein
VLFAAGCSSGTNGPQDATDTTAQGVTEATTFNGVPLPSTTTTDPSFAFKMTFSVDETPIVRAPDIATFCHAFVDAQGLYDTWVVLTFKDPLGLLAAPGQGRSAARKMRESVPDEISDSANAYADLIDHAGQRVGAATSLRRLSEATATASAALGDDQVAPLLNWYGSNCAGATF